MLINHCYSHQLCSKSALQHHRFAASIYFKPRALERGRSEELKKTAKGKVERLWHWTRGLNNGLTDWLKERKKGVEKKHVWHSNQILGEDSSTTLSLGVENSIQYYHPRSRCSGNGYQFLNHSFGCQPTLYLLYGDIILLLTNRLEKLSKCLLGMSN